MSERADIIVAAIKRSELDCVIWSDVSQRMLADEIDAALQEPTPYPAVSESCATCFYGREMTFDVQSSGLRSAQREEKLLLVCARQSPALRADPVLEARWSQVREDHWCGDWSASGGPQGGPSVDGIRRRVLPKQAKGWAKERAKERGE
jgi:hypothetical protein